MSFRKLEEILIYLIVGIIFSLVCWPVQAVNIAQYQCPDSLPLLVYVLNEDGSVKAIVGTYQYGYILCVDQYCQHEDSRMAEDIIYPVAEQAGRIRKIQLP